MHNTVLGTVQYISVLVVRGVDATRYSAMSMLEFTAHETKATPTVNAVVAAYCMRMAVLLKPENAAGCYGEA